MERVRWINCAVSRVRGPKGRKLLLLLLLLLFFFLQAEDGIRYLVRSRGLGGVYKRQGENRYGRARKFLRKEPLGYIDLLHLPIVSATPVSYTHLTLPTIYAV